MQHHELTLPFAMSHRQVLICHMQVCDICPSVFSDSFKLDAGGFSAKRARDEDSDTDHQQQLGTNVTSGKNHVKQSRLDSSNETQDQNQQVNATKAQEGSCIVYVSLPSLVLLLLQNELLVHLY